MKMRQKISFLLLVFYQSILFADIPVSIFPEAEEGMKKAVLQLPKKQNEALFKIELIVKKQILADKVNRYFFTQSLKTKTVAGFGVQYYIINDFGPATSTKMGCGECEKQAQWVAIPSTFIRYNSQIPVVVYLPENATVEYRMWRGEKLLKPFKTGI